MNDTSKSTPAARIFAMLLLIIGVLALGSAMLQILLPLAALAAIISLTVLAIRNRRSGQVQIGRKICEVSLDTMSEATRITGKTLQAATTAGNSLRQNFKS